MQGIINTHHRRSPLVQGSLEIPVEVIVSMDSSDANKQTLRRCQIWVELKYKEPIDGQFRDATAEILRMLQDSDELLKTNLLLTNPTRIWEMNNLVSKQKGTVEIN